MERYGIIQEDVVGKVLWHSMNKNGNIGVYDMKFGNTIIRNLSESDIEEAHKTGHKRDEKHGVQKKSDASRGQKK